MAKLVNALTAQEVEVEDEAAFLSAIEDPQNWAPPEAAPTETPEGAAAQCAALERQRDAEHERLSGVTSALTGDPSLPWPFPTTPGGSVT